MRELGKPPCRRLDKQPLNSKFTPVSRSLTVKRVHTRLSPAAEIFAMAMVAGSVVFVLTVIALLVSRCS